MPPWTRLSHLGSCKYLYSYFLCVMHQYGYCYIAGNFFPYSAHSHWLLWGHTTSNNACVYFFPFLLSACMHPRNFGSHVMVLPSALPSVHTKGKPMWNVILASMGACNLNLIIDIHFLVNWQLSKQGICWAEWHDSIVGSSVNSSVSHDFFHVLHWPVISF